MINELWGFGRKTKKKIILPLWISKVTWNVNTQQLIQPSQINGVLSEAFLPWVWDCVPVVVSTLDRWPQHGERMLEFWLWPVPEVWGWQRLWFVFSARKGRVEGWPRTMTGTPGNGKQKHQSRGPLCFYSQLLHVNPLILTPHPPTPILASPHIRGGSEIVFVDHFSAQLMSG